MMRGRSPPKHRHDGTSPLPLGMDWSPPPKKWNGRDTVWPHDPQTGWSYCVMIPSWVALPKSRSTASDPIVFYRVQVGIQSPAGVTTTRAVLRRFNDFLKLFSDLKREFPKKSIPSAPPKGLLRMRSRALLDERRRSLEEWMTKLLSDIDISRSIAVASFLELEAAARASFQEGNQHSSEGNASPNSTVSSHEHHHSSSLTALAGSASMTSNYGSDTAYETSDLGSPSLGRDDTSEVGLEDLTFDDDLTNPIENLVKYGMSNIEEGLLMGETILDQLEGFPRRTGQMRDITNNGSTSKATSSVIDRMDTLFESNHGGDHTRKLSDESIESDMSSYRGSELSNSWAPNLVSEGSVDVSGGSEIPRAMVGPSGAESRSRNHGQLYLPRDQQPKLDRVLMTMQRRLVTAKTDMEDLITRLNQEIAVKEYLTTRVKDLEVELETTKEKSKENLQQAVSLEKDRITKMQWDMEELRRKSLEMELRLKSQEGDKLQTESPSMTRTQEKDDLLQELDTTKEQLIALLKKHEELELKSKSDIKVLVKEVKSLRRSQNELQQQLHKSLQEKFEIETLLHEQEERNEHALAAKKRLLSECEILRGQLQECAIKFDTDSSYVVDSSSMSKILDLLTESDNHIGVLLAETQSLAPEAETLPSNDDMKRIDTELRQMLRDIFADNAKLRKQVNSFIRSMITMDDEKEDAYRESVLKQLFKMMS